MSETLPKFTEEMEAQDAVILGEGNTFKLPESGIFAGWWYNDPDKGWEHDISWGGVADDCIYAAPRDSEVARINGLGTVKESLTTEDETPSPETDAAWEQYVTFDTSGGPIYKFSAADIADIARKFEIERNTLRAENERLTDELERWNGLRDVSFQVHPGEHGCGEEIDPTPESIRSHLAYLQEEWNGAERRLGASERANRELVEALDQAIDWLESCRDRECDESELKEVLAKHKAAQPDQVPTDAKPEPPSAEVQSE